MALPRVFIASSGMVMRMEPNNQTMSFSDALIFVKKGRPIAREGWNGKNMKVVFQKGYPEGIAINKNTSEALGIPEGTVVKFRSYLMMQCVDGSCVPWLASQSDILEEDWVVLDA